eukprot:scaffold38904_cov35-Tisochrysis_lutea.AAC.2
MPPSGPGICGQKREGVMAESRACRCPNGSIARVHAASTLYTRRECIVCLFPPIRPGIFLPGKTRVAYIEPAEPPREPGLRCESEWPCDAGWPLNPHRRMTPWNPLPFETP